MFIYMQLASSIRDRSVGVARELASSSGYRRQRFFFNSGNRDMLAPSVAIMTWQQPIGGDINRSNHGVHSCVL